ncbi:DUF503 family protein [candidate division WOR-3 bacterium]|uniref:DUF503 family protein n=1 Tax=candidate division WOR-3 bacterium TaxID=2052148 RepID=A0A9D5K7E5_UNCW3|nr:DUF503 family protein [candidate division WOR-3 bacterium]MBD3363706.1 DUF503 family protein [candidate division WOR-3 bacterium]
MIGLLEIELLNNSSRSLKDKRRELNRLIDKLHREFGVAVAEVGAQNTWQRTELAVVTVSNNGRHNNRVLERVVNRIRTRHLAWQLLDYSIREVF